MDPNEKIHVELLKRLKIFSESYFSNKSIGKRRNSNFKDYKKHSHEKIDSHKRHKKHKIKFSTNLNEIEKINLNNNNFNSSKNNHHNTHSVLSNNFHGKTKFYKKALYKSEDKIIKINLVSQKFKIANDFNEKNSNQFLVEKDECLREVILSDKIEEEECVHFYAKNGKENKYEISIIKKNEVNNYLNTKQSKRIIVKDDSEKFLSELIEEIN